MNRDTKSRWVQSQGLDKPRRMSSAKMQGLSSKAHAFSVEALVGKPCKRLKVSEEHVSSSRGHTDTDASIFSGSTECPLTQTHEEDFQVTEAESAELSSKPKENKCTPQREVRVELQSSELWKRFFEIGTEMIITKAGRRMFPSVRVKVRNLDPCQQYYIAMDIMPVDSKRYRYVYHSSQWMVAGNTDHSCISPRLYVHADSPCAGETWMRQVISFDRVKLTNNEMDDKGHIILQSMHKYKPRVHIIQHDPRMDLSQIQSLPAEGVFTFSFPETEFTTVTAYQNQQITKLKIDRNPFAKGFRDPGRNRGVLDGLLESYPWRSPLSLDFKPFAIQLQGSLGSPTGTASPLKSLLPLSSSSSLLSLSYQDTALHTLALPYYGKTSTSPSLASRAFSAMGADRFRCLPPVSPLKDPPLFSMLQGKKLPNCRDPDLSRSSPPCLIPFPSPLSPQRAASSLMPHLSESVGPYCVYRYSFPLNPQLATMSQHTKLAEDNTEALLQQPSWHLAANHRL
ncbi:T-box transcription factor TBX22 [Syngnathus acus]|uniref:T-box transcription factor TBX22 n=1 Tax=Syngnathus acus TaxID=161584 RepID=UPI00188616F8|nr:T-box transcription factor TBX22 [Syngnathus acus]